MEVHRHKLWHIVGNNVRVLRASPPEGYAPVVEVFLVGRPEPVRLSYVGMTWRTVRYDSSANARRYAATRRLTSFLHDLALDNKRFSHELLV